MAKRIWRNDMPQTQRDKIAQAMRGRHLTATTRRLISQALQKYWADLPFKPVSGTTSTTGTTPTTGTTTGGW